MTLAVLLLISLALLLFGMWIPFVVAGAGIGLLCITQGLIGLNAVGLVTWSSVNSFTLTSIPLYVLMAEFLLRSGLAGRLYRGLNHLTRRLPGGLLQTNIAGCAVFSAISGSSVTTAAAIATVAFPELHARKYPMHFAYGSLAAGGTLGIMIPPSIAMIIYGTFTEVSIVKLFMAGVIPGICLALMFMLYIGFASRFMGANAEVSISSPEEKYSTLLLLADVAPTVGLIVLIVGSLYMGWAAPTEAAAVGCSLALVFSLIWGEMNWKILRECFAQTISLSTSILFIVVMAFLFSYAVTRAGLPRQLAESIGQLHLSKYEFLFILIAIFVVLGMFVESIAMIVITVPLLFPLLAPFGIDSVWFCVFLVVMVELGQITPPFGINLFVIQSIAETEFSQVIRGVIPYIFIFVLFSIALMVFPYIALWLPSITQ